MFKLLRYFSLTSLIGFILISLLLGMFYRSLAVKDLTDLAQDRNIALSKVFANSVWPPFKALMSSTKMMNGIDLRQQPQIDAMNLTLKELTRDLSVLKVKIYNPEGITVFSTDLAQVGEDKSKNRGFIRAINRKVTSGITQRGNINAFEGDVENVDELSSYVPIRGRDEGKIEGIFEIYYDVTPLLAKIDRTQNWIVVGVTCSLAILYLFLFLIVSHANQIIRREYNQRLIFEDELQKANVELESRVKERTSEIGKINDQLMLKFDEQKKSEAALEQQAIRDPLTGLYNRRYFNECMKTEIKRADRDKKSLGIILCDLDHFKQINDTRGH